MTTNDESVNTARIMSRFDRCDLQLRVRLSVTYLFLFVLLGLVTDDVKLFAFALLYHLSSDRAALKPGGLETLGRRNGYHIVKRIALTICNIKLFNKDDVALADLVLLSARRYNSIACAHEKHLSFVKDSL